MMHNLPPNEFLIHKANDNYTISLNIEFILNISCQSLSIDFRGDLKAKTIFILDLSGLSKINKITQIYAQNANIDLSTLDGKVRYLSFENCNIYNKFSNNFICDEMELMADIASDNDYLQWIDSSSVRQIELDVCFSDKISQPQRIVQLNYLCQYKNLNKIIFNQFTVDMSKLDLRIDSITFKNCNIYKNATNRFQVNNLEFIYCRLRTSQLIGARITNLIVQNYCSNNCDDCRNPTLVDDLPNFESVKIVNCYLKQLQTFSQPKIKQLIISEMKSNLISFKFFTNVQSLSVEDEPEHLKKYNSYVEQNTQVKTLNENAIIKLYQKCNDHKSLILFLKDKTGLLTPEKTRISVGVE
ncbi:Hypothetical_protein [Hexamita inflata]|uniref:Hypothetical_protein n=1 Tax=Hexamita inflata TaxID=28002 RepID=A0AA86PDJ7_9EUKA|nr:Hypothetical protein HINF_LOCUS24724 [Hexamita inflata]